MINVKKCILVVSNMYPDKIYPYYGTFVKNFCAQLETIHINYKLSVMTKKVNLIMKIIGYIIFYIETFIKCMSGQYEYIYIHYASHSSLPVLLASKLKKMKILVNVHGSDVYPLKTSHNALNRMTAKIIKNSKNVIVPSEYFRNVVAEKYSYPKKDIVVYPSGGIDAKVFYEYKNEEKRKLRKNNGLHEDINYIGFVSRIDKAKGWDIYINAAKVVIDNGYRCGFIMVGSGPDDDILTRKIRVLGLDNVIKRYPQQPQNTLANYYNMMDVFTFPTVSLSESLGLVAIEAMACGCPVIGSDYAAPGTYIIDGENGFKFPKGDYMEMAVCIEKYLNCSYDKKKELKNHAKKLAAEYNSKKIGNILQKILT